MLLPLIPSISASVVSGYEIEMLQVAATSRLFRASGVRQRHPRWLLIQVSRLALSVLVPGFSLVDGAFLSALLIFLAALQFDGPSRSRVDQALLSFHHKWALHLHLLLHGVG